MSQLSAIETLRSRQVVTGICLAVLYLGFVCQLLSWNGISTILPNGGVSLSYGLVKWISIDHTRLAVYRTRIAVPGLLILLIIAIALALGFVRLWSKLINATPKAGECTHCGYD